MNTMDFYGAEWCPDCQRAKSYIQDNDINFQYFEVDKHEWATATQVRA